MGSCSCSCSGSGSGSWFVSYNIYYIYKILSANTEGIFYPGQWKMGFEQIKTIYMKTEKHDFLFDVYDDINELEDADRKLLETARLTTGDAYVP
ncbi:MAG: hypothetical protein ABIQ56_01695, partial [Chitinophagaceae bacterium]